MADKPCDNIQDMLVDYGDGELSVAEKAQVEEHLATCKACREELQALERSLGLTKVIWRDQEVELAKIEPLNLGRKNRKLELRWAALAASILIALGVVLLWQANSPSKRQVIAPPTIPEPTATEIERAVHRAGIAAQMLAVADYFAEIPGGEPFAKERYSYLANSYEDIEVGQKAIIRLKTIQKGEL